jgi:photosystem II stability/assembly factor-like uncharacterized protein
LAADRDIIEKKDSNMITSLSIKQNSSSFPIIIIFSAMLILMQIFIQHGSASAETWESFPLSGGKMLSIVMNPTNENIIYVSTMDAGVFKTTDGGTSWQPARNGLPYMPIRSLVIDKNNTNVLYAGTDFNGIWKTTNAGNSWFYSGAGLDTGKVVTTIVINPLNSQILYTGLRSRDYGNIFKSENGGISWEQQDNGLPKYWETETHPVVTLAIDPMNPETLYTGTTWDGAFKTTDGGENWQAINCGIPENALFDEVQALALDPHHANRLSGIIRGNYYIYSDNCWVMTGEQAGFGPGAHHLYFHPTNTSVLFSAGGGAGGYFSKSTDGGQNWLRHEDRLQDVNEIAFHSSYPDTIYAATEKYGTEWAGFTSGGVYKSINGGTTWSEATQGIYARVISNVAVDPQNSQNIYTIVGSGMGADILLLKSQDQGETWQQGDNLRESSMSFLAVNPYFPEQIYTGSWGFGNLYFSNDHGDNFTAISEVSGGATSIAFDHASSEIIYVGTSRNGVYKSYDSGATWTQKNNGLPSDSFGETWVDSVAVDPGNSSVIWAGTNSRGGIFKSENGGESWILKGLDESNEDVHKIQTIAINADNSNTILIGAAYTQKNIWKTTDGGNSWKSTLSNGVHIEEIIYDPQDSNIVYAATKGSGVLRSMDGGETWQNYGNGIFYPVVYSLEVTNENPPLLVAGSYGSGLYSFQEKISVAPISGLSTTEEGGTATFTVVLNKQPTSDVTIGLSSSDTSEGMVSPDSLVFSTVNWNVPQVVTITGQDDGKNDGDITYTVATAAAVSLDMEYNGRDAVDVRVINIDNDNLLCFPIKSKTDKVVIICM